MSTGGENLRALHKALMLGSALFLLGAAPSAAADVTFESWSPIVETTTQMIASTEAKPGHQDRRQDLQLPGLYRRPADQGRERCHARPDRARAGRADPAIPGFLAAVAGLRRQGLGAELEGQALSLAVEQSRLGNEKGDENFYGLPMLTQTINLWYTIPVMQEAGLAAAQDL